jgi:3-phenylpropionate/cinnamic acid dioxygenase small subunit
MAGELRSEVEDFYFYEADLLDERRYHEWLEMFTDDAHYWMPTRENSLGRFVEDEVAKPGGMAYMDDTKQMLQWRVERLDTRMAWSEVPASRTRHMVSNVRVKEKENAEIEARSNFLVYRSRLETAEDIFVGMRQDVLRRVDGRLMIARRTVILDEAVITARNLSVFL